MTSSLGSGGPVGPDAGSQKAFTLLNVNPSGGISF